MHEEQAFTACSSFFAPSCWRRTRNHAAICIGLACPRGTAHVSQKFATFLASSCETCHYGAISFRAFCNQARETLPFPAPLFQTAPHPVKRAILICLHPPSLAPGQMAQDLTGEAIPPIQWQRNRSLADKARISKHLSCLSPIFHICRQNPVQIRIAGDVSRCVQICRDNWRHGYPPTRSSHVYSHKSE